MINFLRKEQNLNPGRAKMSLGWQNFSEEGKNFLGAGMRNFSGRDEIFFPMGQILCGGLHHILNF